jgi:hypothetical protein
MNAFEKELVKERKENLRQQRTRGLCDCLFGKKRFWCYRVTGMILQSNGYDVPNYLCLPSRHHTITRV